MILTDSDHTPVQPIYLPQKSSLQAAFILTQTAVDLYLGLILHCSESSLRTLSMAIFLPLWQSELFGIELENSFFDYCYLCPTVIISKGRMRYEPTTPQSSSTYYQ